MAVERRVDVRRLSAVARPKWRSMIVQLYGALDVRIDAWV